MTDTTIQGRPVSITGEVTLSGAGDNRIGWVNTAVTLDGVTYDVGGGYITGDRDVEPYGRAEMGDLDELAAAFGIDPDDDAAMRDFGYEVTDETLVVAGQLLEEFEDEEGDDFDAPECADGGDHDWLEGDDVTSSGGSALQYTDTCRRCGLRRIQVTQDSDTPSRDGVYYEEPERVAAKVRVRGDGWSHEFSDPFHGSVEAIVTEARQLIADQDDFEAGEEATVILLDPDDGSQLARRRVAIR